MQGWFFSRRWLFVKFLALIAVVLGVHVLTYRELERQRTLIASSGFESARLEILSRLESEFDRVMTEGRMYTEGRQDNGWPVTLDAVKLALDVFWSRVGSGGNDAYSQVYVDQGVDVSVLADLQKALPEIEAAVNQLRAGDAKSLEPLNAFWLRFHQRVREFNEAAYVARIRALQNSSEAQFQLFATLHRYQIGVIALGAIMLLLFLAEWFWASRIVDRLRVSNERNRELAEVDALTGLYNRGALDRELSRRLAQPFAESLTAIGVDIDRFRSVNDSLGPTVGDKLLVAIAHRIREVARDGYVSRMAGDEFLVLLGAPITQARDTAAQLAAALSAPIFVGDRYYQPSTSIAVAAQDQAHTPEDVIQSVTVTMSEAKAYGGGAVVEYHADLIRNARENAVIEGDLAHAIQYGQIEIVAQPKVRTVDRSFIGFEALARWNHPSLGFVPPEKFCKVADTIGLSSELGLRVADLAFELGSKIKRAGHAGRTSINVSPAFGSHPAFVKNILQLLEKHDLTPSDIEFEVTEEYMLFEFGELRANMHDIHALGAHVSIDDFGKGHSNISRLSRLAVSVIKADKSLIDNAGSDRASRAILRGLVQLSDELGISLLVEGVETEEQARLLLDIGVKFAQGYLFSRPQPPQMLMSWLAERRGSSPPPLRDRPAA